MLTVARETSVARPAVFATRPAIAAPKAIPSDWIVGMEDAVRILSPGRAVAMLQLADHAVGYGHEQAAAETLERAGEEEYRDMRSRGTPERAPKQEQRSHQVATPQI